MKKMREFIFMGIGILAGFALCGPAAQAADHLTATLTTQTFYVNGQQIQFEAYAIHGNNFVKLRDIGEAVDFGVTYDGTTNSVHIDPNAHYQKEATTPASTQTSPSALTEKTVQTILQGLKDKYPSGSCYPTPYRSSSNPPYHSGMNCAGWAILCSDAAFGDLPWRKIANPRWEDIRPGDLIEYDNAHGGHVVVVVRKTDEYISVTDSDTTQKVYWGGQYFRWWLEQQPGYTAYTRYPQ